MVARKKNLIRKSLFRLSWEIVKNNKILFFPNIAILISNIILLGLLFNFTGFGISLWKNNLNNLIEVTVSLRFFSVFVIYLILNMLIDNFFYTFKYGLIKDILLKGKTDLRKGFYFAKKYYWTTLGIHILSVLIIFISMALLALLIFLMLPLNQLVTVSVFIPLLIVYFVYMSIRLFFIYPIMTFEKKGAYNSLVEDFHFVKTHFSHTFVSWLVVVGISILVSIINKNIGYVSEILYGQLFILGLIGFSLIIVIEFIVSVWEHVYIFKSYLTAKKRSS